MEASTVAKIAGPGLDKKTLLNFLHQMLLIRKFEDKSGELYARGKIAGFLHLYNGQEASAVGAISTLAQRAGCESVHGRAVGQGHRYRQRSRRFDALL